MFFVKGAILRLLATSRAIPSASADKLAYSKLLIIGARRGILRLVKQ
jgi:hypothetical protein